jgi:hypothetical protein
VKKTRARKAREPKRSRKLPPRVPISKAQKGALEEAIARFAQRPDVTGIDVGFAYVRGRREDELAVRIHVREKYPQAEVPRRDLFPREIAGVRVDVLQGCYVDHAVEPDPSRRARRRRQEPVRPGLSIGLVDAMPGTLGAVMWDRRNEQVCVLSSRHVLVGAASAVTGSLVLQPGRDDGGRDADRFAFLERADASTDAAIALVDLTAPFRRDVSLAAHFSKVVLQGAREPEPGDVLEKSGRSTGVTRGFVDGIGLNDGLRSSMRLRPLPGAADPKIARPGDSGAVWYDPRTREAVGLHCKGPQDPSPVFEFAVATRMTKVIFNLELDFVTPPEG